MSFKRIILNYTFDEDIRTGLVFSDITKVRLSPETQRIQLKADPVTGDFSTDNDLFIKTPLLTPNRVNKFLKFEAIVTDDLNGIPAGTLVQFKVRTTGDDYWWNPAGAGAWEVAGASDWSPEADINANLETFPIATVGNKSIGFIVNLKTTDPKVTPDVKEIKLLCQFDIEFLEDLLYDSVIRKFNTEFRTSSLTEFVTSGSTASQDLKNVIDRGEETGYNITGVRSVYNLTDDELRLTNLHSSYALGTVRRDKFTNGPGIETFTAPIPSGKVVEITFEYITEIFIRTSQDFFEVPAFPSIVFENIESIVGTGLQAPAQNSIGEDFIRDKANLTAVQQFSPRQTPIRFEYAVFTDSQLDQTRLMNDINEFLSNIKQISSWGLDNPYDLKIIDELNTRNQKDIGDTDTNTATGVFDVLGVLFYDKPARDVALVGKGQVNIVVNP